MTTKGLVIIQQNACGRDVCNGTRSLQDHKRLIERLKLENTDVLFLSEFCYANMFATTKEALNDYEFVKPLALSTRDEHNENLSASCILAIKHSAVLTYTQTELANMLALRYICANLRFTQGATVNFLLTYMPQTYGTSPDRIKWKAKMFCSASQYVERNCALPLFVGGDMNSDIDGRTTSCISDFEKLYSSLTDTDREKKPTWNGKRLDYALVSYPLRGAAETEQFTTNSDHAALKTILYI